MLVGKHRGEEWSSAVARRTQILLELLPLPSDSLTFHQRFDYFLPMFKTYFLFFSFRSTLSNYEHLALICDQEGKYWNGKNGKN